MYRYLAIAAAALALTGPAPAQQPDTRVYELRTYTPAAGRADELHARFRDHTVRLLNKHGATSHGYWRATNDPDGKLVYLLSYPSRSAREATWANLAGDPEWLRAKRASERLEGKLVVRIEETFLTPTAYSPAISTAAQPGSHDYELRTASAPAAEAAGLHDRLQNRTFPALERTGATVVGVWTVAGSADTTKVVYLVSRPTATADYDAPRPRDVTFISAEIGAKAKRTVPRKPREQDETLALVPTSYSPLK